MKNWLIESPLFGHFISYRCIAMTKSEARSIFKKKFKLKRVPIGALITEEPPF